VVLGLRRRWPSVRGSVAERSPGTRGLARFEPRAGKAGPLAERRAGEAGPLRRERPYSDGVRAAIAARTRARNSSTAIVSCSLTP
jgi:hypothetical protein